MEQPAGHDRCVRHGAVGHRVAEWNVTAQLQAQFDAGALHGFLIRDASENQGSNEQQFHSREKSSEQPQLLVTYVPAPPPPTATTSTTTTVPGTTTTTTAPPACTTSMVTVDASADAWVLQSSPSNNHATDSVMKVDSKSGNDARALVRFDLPAPPAGSRSPRPSYGCSPARRPTLAPCEWSVTGAVQAMYTTGNNGFLIRDASEGGGGFEQQLHSRKAPDNPPQLVITFGP